MINILARFYLCLVLGLGPGVGRGVLTWLMSSMLARGARGVLALLDMITVNCQLSPHSRAQSSVGTETEEHPS